MSLLLDHRPPFKINEVYSIPDQVNILLAKYYQYSYEELYEKSDQYPVSLEDALITILEALKDDYNQKLTYFRYFCLTLILCLSVRPTIKIYFKKLGKKDVITKDILQYIVTQLLSQQTSVPQQKQNLIYQKFKQIHLERGRYQAFDEAIDVWENSLRFLIESNSQLIFSEKFLLEILEDCLEGYAIFPGSEGRRELFNWWLSDVIPAAFSGKFPRHLYTINSVETNPYQSLYQLRSLLWKLLKNHRDHQITLDIDCEMLSCYLEFIAGN